MGKRVPVASPRSVIFICSPSCQRVLDHPFSPFPFLVVYRPPPPHHSTFEFERSSLPPFPFPFCSLIRNPTVILRLFTSSSFKPCFFPDDVRSAVTVRIVLRMCASVVRVSRHSGVRSRHSAVSSYIARPECENRVLLSQRIAARCRCSALVSFVDRQMVGGARGRGKPGYKYARTSFAELWAREVSRRVEN